MRVTWNAPEGRFFDTGLDRGMLYPKGTPPLGEILATNLATNPRVMAHNNVYTERLRNYCINPSFAVNTSQWITTDAGTVISRDTTVFETGVASLKMVCNGAQGNQGAYYDPIAIASLTPGQYFGTMVRVKAPAGTPMNLYAINQPEGGNSTVITPFTATGEWQTVIAQQAQIAVNENPYIVIRTQNHWVTPVTFHVDRAMIFTANDAPEWFDGNSPDVNGVRYSWAGTANASHSILEGTLPDNWLSQGPIIRFADEDTGWLDIDAYRWVYASAGLTVGKYYAYRMTVTGPPGTIVTPQSTDNVVGGIGDGTPQTIPASGVLEFVVRSAAVPVAGPGGNFGYTATRRTRVSRAVLSEVKGPGMLPVDAARTFFDGDSEEGAYTYAWTGAQYGPSTKREVLTYAVPWGGLVSVDEEGGDGAASYYIDGRPFLFLPRPKEYKATLKAFTYPDAFSDIMGVTEVADGMYLDSQPGKAFDLCYRTTVGNALEGVDHGYKIHLVYNATVTPQALTYESLSNSINPTTFSWEIQAVPVRVEGFRPTAHIIIDTRHMDPTKIAAIEALVYGSEEENPHMPSPQVIFDLLSFGDTIIVTDNGDGTFDVTGSYENVYLVGPGVFRVDNVDGQDNGDGTFTISTTTA